MSEAQRKKLNRRLWGKMREIIGDADVAMHDDPLGQRYSVNKHAIIVEGDDYEVLLDIRNRLLALLTVEGWDTRKERSSVAVKHPCSIATAYINEMNETGRVGGYLWRWDVGIYN